eukprot:m.178708 g.178708  ORF g.178708 m.178708 type:complete len:95 (+) comp16595_c0_seq1:1291-1575(+)
MVLPLVDHGPVVVQYRTVNFPCQYISQIHATAEDENVRAEWWHTLNSDEQIDSQLQKYRTATYQSPDRTDCRGNANQQYGHEGWQYSTKSSKRC